MKKTIISLLSILFLLPGVMLADGYTQLWKKVDDAAKKDLPKTQIECLKAIIDKAEREKNYGQLLKAEWQTMWTWHSISPDSLAPQIERLEQKAVTYEKTDPALAAVCYAALGKTAGERWMRSYKAHEQAPEYLKKAMANPALLAQKKAEAYAPFTVKGRDADLFGGDLLSLIGYTAGDYKAMHDYYATTSNRTATLLTALDMVRDDAMKTGLFFVYKKDSQYMESLDSLTRLYSDLPACAEVAISRYDVMKFAKDITAQEKSNFLNDAINRWSPWRRTDKLRNELKELTRPYFNATTERSMVLPNRDFTMKYDVRNIKELRLTLTRLNATGADKLYVDSDKEYNKVKALKIASSAVTMKKAFGTQPEYEVVSDSFIVKGLPVGVYLVEVETDNNSITPDRDILYVTDMFIIHQELPGNKMRFAVLSGTTGQPVAGAKLDIRHRDDKRKVITCKDNGEALFFFDKTSVDEVRAYTDTDNAAPFVSAYNNFSYNENTFNRDVASLFTDRKIYRPGQTVHVAMVLRHIDKLEQNAIANRTVKLTLKDANYKTVAEKNVTTDEFGTASADFTLPSGGLTGSFSIRTENLLGGSVGFRVEEYKRPTFQVEFDKVKEMYENGDTVTVTGRAKAYSGVAVQGAKVKYTVRRKQALWWRFSYTGAFFNENDNAVLAEGEAVTDGKGEFKIRVPMQLPVWEESIGISKDDYYRIARFYNIVTEADVTDMAGESHNGEISLPLGNKPTSFACDVPEQTLRDSLKTIIFSLKNSAGNNIDGDVTYTVSGIYGTFSAKTNTPTELTWNTMELLKSGRHTITAICGNDTVRRDFVVFSYDDTVPCVETPDWFNVSGDVFPRDGSPIYLQFGSSDTDVHVLYTVISGNKLLKSGSLELSNAVKTYRLPYKEEYGSGVRINLIWVKEGKVYNHNFTIQKPLPDKRLILKWTTFRDRLTPGQQEEWTLNITRPDGKPANAQLLATMYDASLDQLTPFSWYFNQYTRINLPWTAWRTANIYPVDFYGTLNQKLASVKSLDFGNIETNLNNILYAKEEVAITGYGNSTGKYLTGSTQNIMVRGTAPVMKKNAETRTTIGAFNASADAALAGDVLVQEESAKAPMEEETAPTEPAVPLRENLNETAFFYPALVNNTVDGNVSIKFTLPESVTTWRFMGFAHDKEMNYGQIEGKAIAAKTVMVQPNMPRFVRVGDRANISARILNTADKTVKGTAIMQLVDPETEKVILEIKQKFEVDADSTGAVSFSYRPDSNHSLLVCRIFAEGKDFSDGEQHYLPILSDAELVTTTVPFTQHEPGVKTIDLKPLFPENGRSEKLTIEYTNNPAWLVLQALPYISNLREDNAINLATAYYANSIGAYMMKQSPRIKSVFDQWKHETGQESLMSSLEKNQELKNMVLNETPWIADADRESDQKQMLANYFDESTLNNNLTTALEKLRKLQNSADGSWCWWPGMRYGSPTLTAAITETLVRLDNMIGAQTETKTMTDKAIKFLGDVVMKEYEEIKKNEKKGMKVYINVDNAVHYLYICAISNHKPTAKENEAAQYMLEELKKYNVDLNLYYKALMAVILADEGDKQLARQYVQSLDEYSVATEEMGRYYDSPRTGYSWFDYGIPTQVAAIEAMTLVDAQGYAKTIDEMKRWLLQQKRVQGWTTPFNNVNAVYAFLNGNMKVLESKAETTLAVDGKTLELPKATAGLGYVKTSIKPDGSDKFTATKTSEGTSWGAVYAQSVQQTSTITSASAGMSVTREILSADGKPATALNIGDKITVRITIRADRDYDYVQVTDKRAACMEPVNQLSGYRKGYYCTPKDNATNYYFDRMGKGTHVIETEYYIDRAGLYETGTCTVQCAYAPEYSARTASTTLDIK